MKSGRKAVWVALCLLVVSVVLLAVFLFVESRGKAGVLHTAWAPSVDGQTMAALLVDETDTAAGPEEEHPTPRARMTQKRTLPLRSAHRLHSRRPQTMLDRKAVHRETKRRTRLPVREAVPLHQEGTAIRRLSIQMHTTTETET